MFNAIVFRGFGDWAAMGFKENLRYYRKRSHLNQRELSERLGVVRNTVTQWESGYSQPRMGMVTEIANVLDVSVSRLISEAPPGLPDDGILSGEEEYRLVSLYRQLNLDGQAQLLSLAQGLVTSGVFRREPGEGTSIQAA